MSWKVEVEAKKKKKWDKHVIEMGDSRPSASVAIHTYTTIILPSMHFIQLTELD